MWPGECPGVQIARTFGATDTRSGHRLPAMTNRWLYHAELQNALHAAVFGVRNFESAKRTITRRGYMLFTEGRFLRNCN